MVDANIKAVGMASVVNAELTQLYWHIDTDLLQGQRGEYGKQVVAEIVLQLTADFGKGWSKHSAMPLPASGGKEFSGQQKSFYSAEKIVLVASQGIDLHRRPAKTRLLHRDLQSRALERAPVVSAYQLATV